MSINSNSNSCNICCDTFNKSNRSKVCCNYCDYQACRVCCETYILSETIPKCMNPSCAKEWSRKFIREKFTNVFINTKYKEHLEGVLFDQERALLPATQPLVEEEIRKEKVRKEIREVDKKILELQRQRRDMEQLIHYAPPASDAAASGGGPRFVRSCPADGCRGFLSSQWKCGICEKWTCAQCHELKGDTRDCEHTCDPNSVETAKLLAKDTKPCPKCQTPIFKINGCDQIWCTQCHTAFNWKTGALEKNIHNPHYYEWQRKNGGLARAAGDVECGRDLNHYTTDTILQLIKEKHSGLRDLKREKKHANDKHYYRPPNFYLPIVNKLTDIIRIMIHNVRYELPQYQTDYVERNQALRIQFLKQEISEEQFKWQIQVNDKKSRKNTEIAQVIQLANTAATDIVHRIIDNLRNSATDKHNLEGIMMEFDEIIRYCNDIFKDIAFTYNCVQHGFDGIFTLIRIEKEKKAKKVAMKEEDSDLVVDKLNNISNMLDKK